MEETKSKKRILEMSRVHFLYGFIQLSALEFLRSGTETWEIENHLLLTGGHDLFCIGLNNGSEVNQCVY